MIVRKNKNKQTSFIYNKVGDVEAYIATPYKHVKKATVLTVRKGKTKIDLNGRQIASLRRVLAKSEQIKNQKP